MEEFSKEDTSAEPDQLAAVVARLFELLRLTVESIGVIRPDELGDWLRMMADERDRQGDYGAARILDRLANDADKPFKDEV